ncbi:MAG: DUF2809 domain-containing protein [Minicystis sp.]
MAEILGPPPDRRRRARLLAVCLVAAAIGFASKRWGGPGRGVVVGQFEDFFGTIFLILAPRILLLRAPLWKVAGPVLAIVVGIEISQAFHGELLDRARSTWLGLRVLGTTFGWDDLLAYALATGAAVGIDRWAARASAR